MASKVNCKSQTQIVLHVVPIKSVNGQCYMLPQAVTILQVLELLSKTCCSSLSMIFFLG